MNHMQTRVPLDRLKDFNVAEKNKVRFGFIHDTVKYAAAGHDALSLFAVPEGGMLNDNSRSKTAADTNLTSSGSLSKNQAMLVKGVEILFMLNYDPGQADADSVYTAATQKFGVNDAFRFLNSGLLHLSMKGVDIIKDGPLSQFPPATRFDVSAAMVGTDTDNNKIISALACVGRPYPLEWFLWEGGDILTAKLEWPNGKVPMPSNNDSYVKVRLYGDIYEAK